MFSAAAVGYVHEDAAQSVSTSSLQAGGPVAVIGWLPNEVSNGTWWNLDASDSHDQDGVITNYTWNITINNATTYLYGQGESFKFKALGLYKILLTVRNASGNSSTAFTAVYSIVDLDGDDLPDWWEVKYFGSIAEQSRSDDYDNDGYSNLQEYASGTDPIVKDPQPTLMENLKAEWMYLAAIAAVVVALVLALWPIVKKRRKQEENKTIEAALEIERALEGEK
ncbi:MAG: PKD domain-containing protein [Candidatus Thermoplasmatota archaeon]|nr:PKD domain-containing protein [Candidatus Thermoplasmatota archaeon]